LCGRLLALSRDIWVRHPEWLKPVEASLVAIFTSAFANAEDLAGQLERFAAEDDGSPAWGYAVALADTLGDALRGESVASCVTCGLRRYLDAASDAVSLRLSAQEGRPVSQDEVEAFSATDGDWRRANRFADALS
jgi:hypothetical protein